MAPRKSDLQIIEELLAQFEPEIRAAFLEAVQDLADYIELKRLIEALQARDLDKAMRSLHLEEAAFRKLERVIADAFEAGASRLLSVLPVIQDTSGVRLGVRFDPGDQQASARIRQHGATLVTRIVEDQRNSLRNAISAGLEAGTNPRTVAIEIAGRFDPRLGRRTGGIVGLTDSQRDIADRAYRMLLDPDEIRGYFIVDAETGVWKPRYAAGDRTFHPAIKKAIREGRALDAETAAKVAARHRDGLLKMRADMIARNESMQAVNAGRDEATRQTIRTAGISEQQVVRTWRAAKDARTRESHQAMDGQQVTGFDQPFVSPTGALLRYPGDPQAPTSETIQCRCTVTISIKRPSVGLE